MSSDQKSTIIKTEPVDRSRAASPLTTLGGVARAKFAPKLPSNTARRFTPIVLNSDRSPSPIATSPTHFASSRDNKPTIKAEDTNDRRLRKDKPAKVTFTAADPSAAYTYTAREPAESFPSSLDAENEVPRTQQSDDWTNQPLMPIAVPFPSISHDDELSKLSETIRDLKLKGQKWKFGSHAEDFDDFSMAFDLPNYTAKLYDEETKESEPFTALESPLRTLQLVDGEEKLTKTPSKRLLFFQLPTHLPWKPSSVASTPSPSTSSQSSAFSLRANHVFHPSFEHTLRKVPPGRIGSLLIMKSGRVKLRIGDCYYEVQNGADLIGHQEVLSVNVKEKRSGESLLATSSTIVSSSTNSPLTSPSLTSFPSTEDTDRKERVFDRQDAIQLGPIGHRYICSIDVNTTLNQIESSQHMG